MKRLKSLTRTEKQKRFSGKPEYQRVVKEFFRKKAAKRLNIQLKA